MKRILSTLTLLLCFAFTAVNAQGTYDQATMGAKVVEMETASWGQNSPFNNYCWSEYGGSTHAKAGCVPVAFAVVMRYHGFPAEGTSSTLYNCQASTYVEVTDRTYDWEKMPLTNGSGWTEEQQHEVAKLISHLGHAFGVSYGVSQTSVSIGDSQTERLTKYFNYKEASATSQYPSNNNLESWKLKIKESLNNGCPVPYAANNTGTGDSRHMFVIDGYTSNDYFHFNFGWNGSGNGWFKLDNITPAQGDNYSWSDASDGYTSKHQAFFNLMPNTTTYPVTATATPSNMGTVSINGGATGSTAAANLLKNAKATLTAHPADGYALANWTKNGEIVGSKNSIQVVVAESDNDYVANFDDASNVYVTKDYIIAPNTVGFTGSSKVDVVTYQTSDEYPAALSLASTTTDGVSLFAMSRISDEQMKLYAYDQATSNTAIRYILSVPDGYVITEYKFEYSLNNISYPCSISYSGGTISSPTDKEWHSSPVIVNNTKTADFTMSAENANANSSFYIKNFTVTVAKEGADEGSGSTPDPDPEPEPTPELVVPTGAVKYGVTFDGATWTRYNGDPIGTNSWIFRVVTNTTPAVTVQVDGDVNNLGFQTINQVKHPYLYRDTNFTITVPESYKIAGYKLTVKGDNFVNGTYTYTTGATTNGTGTITQNGVEQTVIANGLDTRIINVNVGSGSGTAGIIITALEIVYIKEEVEEPGDSTDPLAGKWFRLKEKTAGTYMNIYDNDTHGSGAKGGVNVATLNEDTDGQIFQFIEGDNGYKLQSKTGYYINCQAWNVDANSTTSGAVLTLESTENELEYLIHCNNGYFKIGAVDGNANIGKFVYCNESAKANASTWVLEEVVEGEEPEQPQELFPDGAYKVYWQADNRGYLAYYSGRQDEAVLADVTLGTHGSNHYTSTTEGVDLVWYLITAKDGKRYLFQAATGKFLCVDENTSGGTGAKANKLSTTEATPITVEENPSVSGQYVIKATANNTTALLSSGCGTSSFNGGHPVRWWYDNTASSFYTDGGSKLQLVKVDGVTVTDDVMNAVRAVIEPRTFKFQAEVDGWRNDNPNTHLGTITIGGTPLKLTPEHFTASELTMPLNEGSALAFTRKYRGFEFQGFYIGTTELGTNPTLTAENIAAINETTPLVAKFTATDDVTLFYDDDTYSYRIPAIAKTGTNRLVAISDYRHNLDDIGRDNHSTGKKRIDLVMRTSEDNGATWSDIKTIAAGDDSKVGSYLRAFGDAAVAAVGNNIVVMCAAGDVLYTSGTTDNPNRMARIFSSDNGANWTIEEMTTKMYSQSTSLIPNGGSAFFGSGKLAVDENFNGTGNARIYGALLVRIKNNDGNYSNYNNFVVYSDDLGATWKILGGSTSSIASDDEPKVEILPNGQILLSVRRGGGRKFRVFTYGTGADDKANGVGSWGDAAVNGCDNGGQNATNGEIICLDAKRPNGKRTKILLQSQPKGGSGQYERYNVTIWYKEVSADETYTPSSIASGWTQGLEVCPAGVKSAYSAMCLQENGKIAFFFEEAPCYGDDHTKGYSMVYVPLTIEEITGENFLNPNADVETVTVDVTLTDNEGNTYTHQFDYLPGDAAAIDAALKAAYPFITELGEGNLQGSDTYYTYRNTVTLPFKVSNANTTVWYNIYWPANGNPAFNPVYLSASQATDTYVSKVTEGKVYGESQYNTLAYADELSWAIYNVNNTLTFKFKNKLTGNYIQVTGVATDSNNSGKVQNVKYVAEADATAFTIVSGGSYAGDYALKANVNGTDGYLCSTSSGYGWATHYNGNSHPGGWVKFDEAPDYQAIIDQLIADITNFGDGNDKYTANDAISNIDTDALAGMTINSLNTQKETVQTVKESYTEITLTVPVVNDVVPGSVKILNEPVSHKFVPKGDVTIQAVPAAGYYFVNWTKPAAQASAAARAAAARSGEFVSDANPYTVTVSDALSLEANFDLVVVTATLTDAQGNQYIEQLDGFTNGITKEAVAAKLVEKYPYITLGTEATGITLEDSDGAYTYTNTVTLPFKVTNTTDILYNIYYPSNGGNPNYIATLNEDEVVDMAASKNYVYGANPTYNTKDGNNAISWAIYNVNNSFEFIFKSKVTNKYIKVESVSTSTTNNVKFVDNAEDATAFTLLKDTGTRNGDYALVAKVGETTGYLCATSSTENYVTHFNHTDHQGAWVKFEEAPDYFSTIMQLGYILGTKFGAGNGKCVIAGTEIEDINTAMQNSGTITLNNLTAYAATMDDAMSNDTEWHNVVLNVDPEDSGTAIIQLANDDPALTSKRVPTDYKLTIVATPAEGYHFIKWTNGTEDVSETNSYTFNVTTATTLTANFAKNSYTISVSAGEGGSATASATTVEHGGQVTLTATANDGYRFVNWTEGTDVVSAESSYTFTATAGGKYVANFELANTPVTHYNVTITSNIENKGIYIYTGDGSQNHLTYDVTVGGDVRLIAVNNNSSVGSTGYVFVGWYNGETLVSDSKDYTFTPATNIVLQAKFVEGRNVYGKSNSNQRGTVNIFAADADIDIDDPASDYNNAGLLGISSAMVETGGTVKLMARANWGCRFVKWTGGSTDNPLVVENIQNDVTYTAEFEPASYQLTVRANDDNFGTVSATSGTSTGTTVTVGHNIEATITAIANPGYKFESWTKGTETVSSEATYVIPAIDDVDAMKNVEYIANFVEVEEVEAGTYYRIGYDGFAAAAAAPAARAAATRAVGDTYTYTLTPQNIGLSSSNNSTSSFDYTGTNPVALRMTATTSDGTSVSTIARQSNTMFKLYAYANGSTTIKYNLSVPDGYKITGYNFTYKEYTANTITVICNDDKQITESTTSPGFYVLSVTPNKQTAEFKLQASASQQYYLYVKEFTVTIQEVGSGEGEGGEVGGGETPETPEIPETPSNRYYVQSVACGVSGANNLQNALKMTQETGAASIFYYAGNKLLSYDKGLYIKEDGGTRGLQSVGTSGTVTITTNGNTSTIAAPSYMHAVQGSTCYVDHCSSNTGTAAHSNHNFILEEVTSLPVTISTVGYASWYAPVAVKLPEGVTAWYLMPDGVSDDYDYVTMSMIEYKDDDVYVVPAKTGVILKGPAGTHNLTITTTGYEIGNNLLTGTVAATYVKGDAYVLANGNNGLGLYLAELKYKVDEATENNAWKNNTHKAYLPRTAVTPAMQNSVGFRFRFNAGATTPIEEMETENNGVDVIYDLTGRKLEGISGTGIYIVNGKKVLVK